MWSNAIVSVLCSAASLDPIEGAASPGCSCHFLPEDMATLLFFQRGERKYYQTVLAQFLIQNLGGREDRCSIMC